MKGKQAKTQPRIKITGKTKQKSTNIKKVKKTKSTISNF